MRLSLIGLLDSAFLLGSAAVVWQRGDVLDGLNSEPGSLQGTDGRLPSGAGTFDVDFDLGDAVFFGFGGTFFCGSLCGEGCAFARAFETNGSGGAPTNGVAVDVGDGNNGIVEGSANVSYSFGDGTSSSASAGSGFSLSHTYVPFCHQCPEPAELVRRSSGADN